MDPSKIRRVNIVREARKRRGAAESGLVFIEITIEENAIDLTNTTAVEEQKASFNRLDATITNLFITNQLQETAQALLNVTIASLEVCKIYDLRVLANLKRKTDVLSMNYICLKFYG